MSPMSEPLDLGWHHTPVSGTGCDACTLLAEVERLRGEVESEGHARRVNSRSANFLLETIGRAEPEVAEAKARIEAGEYSEENTTFGHVAAAYITRLRAELARQAESARYFAALLNDTLKAYAELAGMPGDLNSDLHYEVIAARLAERDKLDEQIAAVRQAVEEAPEENQ